MGPIFYYLKIWLEISLAYFYNPMAVGFLTIFLRMLAKFRLISAFLIAFIINLFAVCSFTFFLILTQYEKILPMRFDGNFFSYITILFVWNLLIQAFCMGFISNRCGYNTSYLVILTTLSNIGAVCGMIALVKYRMIV